ncbi:matrixin [Haloplanus salilacus]|uniref:matrixin n=1 Tax=Haloplanus salilacus TaxID=2949994 RepID=UPI0030D23E5C
MTARRSPLAPTLALAVLLVLAGCATPFVPTPTSPDSTTAGTNADTTPATDGVDDGSGGGTSNVTANPWGSDPVVVAVRNEGSRDRTFAPLVREAADFWEANDDRYLGFSVDYEVRPDAEEPDLVVAFTDDVPDCGDVSDAVGCAPLLTDPRQVDRPETVWVQTSLGNESTTLVAKHELGHTLGRTHADAPTSVMRAKSVIYTEPQPNATERAFPWDDTDFTVHVDAANASDPDGVVRQTDRALTYYEDDPPGMPDNLSFERVGSPGPDTEVRIRFGATSSCASSTGSCVESYGTDPDGDGAIETYTRIDVRLVGIDTDAVGWHVGYWLAHALGAEADAEKPPPFRDASYRERRGAWWE